MHLKRSKRALAGQREQWSYIYESCGSTAFLHSFKIKYLLGIVSVASAMFWNSEISSTNTVLCLRAQHVLL